MENQNTGFTLWERIKVVLLLLSFFWLGSILVEQAPACLQPTAFDKVLIEEGFSPCAHLIGGLLVPLAAMVLVLVGLRERICRLFKK